ncbi:MAG: hypothetical protein IIA85_01885 [Nanoarchaeota archaeon]|nr:hypothetical protein [Nanoarchaeota archaeon]
MTLVEIIWLDACKQEKVDQNNFDLMEKSNTDGTGFLTKNRTKGKLYKIYDEVIILDQDENEDSGERDLYSIPRYLIISPRRYRISPKKNIRK